jgi:hypothetical protein
MKLCVAFGLLGIISTSPVGYAQSLISAKSGVVHYTLGDVFLEDKKVEIKAGVYPIRMTSRDLTDTRFEVIEGSAIVECAELLDDNLITVAYKDYSFELLKEGIYRIDTDPARFRVYDGQARVSGGDQQITVKGSRQVDLSGVLTAEKFDSKVGDPLYRWAKRRAGEIATVNVSAAKYARDYGYRSAGGWFYHPYFGMLTYIPFSGAFNSPFGYRFWSPRTVYTLYERPVMNSGWSGGNIGYNPNLGYGTVGRSIGSAPSVASPSSTPAATAATGGASAPRSADTAVGRGDSSGRGR